MSSSRAGVVGEKETSLSKGVSQGFPGEGRGSREQGGSQHKVAQTGTQSNLSDLYLFEITPVVVSLLNSVRIPSKPDLSSNLGS